MIPTRVPPHSILAEQAVLAYLLEHPNEFTSLAFGVSNDSFYGVEHQSVFNALSFLSSKGPFDLLGVLLRLQQLKSTVDRAYLNELSNCAPLGYAYEQHKDTLLDYQRKRVLLRCAQNIESGINDPDLTTDSLAASLLTSLDTLRDDRGVSTWAEASILLMAEINEPTGITLGFDSLDLELKGLRRHALMVIAAGTGIGKTTFALNLAIKQALMGRPVLYGSFEMPASDLVCKMVPMISEIPYSSMFYPSPAEKVRIEAVLATSSNMPIYFETSATDVDKLLASALAHKKRNGVEILFVDHLNLLGVEYEDLAYATRAFKLFADRHELPVVLLCQLNNHYQQRADKDPIESDLRGSGTIAQDADVIVALYKLSKDLPETYMKLLKNRKAMTNTNKYFDIYYEAPSCMYMIGADREKPEVKKRAKDSSTDY